MRNSRCEVSRGLFIVVCAHCRLFIASARKSSKILIAHVCFLPLSDYTMPVTASINIKTGPSIRSLMELARWTLLKRVVRTVHENVAIDY